jgi:hypothetical protein
MLFTAALLEKIQDGKKTQTRRIVQSRRGAKVYQIGERVRIAAGYRGASAQIIIRNRRRQKIGEITEEDAVKEGFADVEEFKQTWLKLFGYWDPNQEVWVYDFVLEGKNFVENEEK